MEPLSYHADEQDILPPTIVLLHVQQAQPDPIITDLSI